MSSLFKTFRNNLNTNKTSSKTDQKLARSAAWALTTLLGTLTLSPEVYAGACFSRPGSDCQSPAVPEKTFAQHLDHLRNLRELSSVNAYSSSKVSSRNSQESQKDLSPASDPTAGGGDSQSSSHSALASKRSRDSVSKVSHDLLAEPLPPTKRFKSEFDPH